MFELEDLKEEYGEKKYFFFLKVNALPHSPFMPTNFHFFMLIKIMHFNVSTHLYCLKLQ